MNYLGKKCTSLMRVERDDKGENMVTNKVIINHGDIQAAAVNVFNI